MLSDLFTVLNLYLALTKINATNSLKKAIKQSLCNVPLTMHCNINELLQLIIDGGWCNNVQKKKKILLYFLDTSLFRKHMYIYLLKQANS